MGYYVRVLSSSEDRIPIRDIQAAIDANNLHAAVKVEVGSPDEWEQVVLCHDDGTEIALIERNAVGEGSLASEELEEFAEDIVDCFPKSAVSWLLDYFTRVRCIFAFQLLRGTDCKNGWDILGVVKNHIHSFAPSIIQADSEGFTNEEGYHILWQFSDSVKGSWWMGILLDGVWRHFQMDLGNLEQRRAFCKGEIPAGVKRV